MSTATLVNRPVGASPRPKARTTGIVYLSFFVTAIGAALLVSRGLVVFGDVVNIVSNALYVTVTLLFYEMFKPVNRKLSLFAALCGSLGSVIQTLELFHLAPFHLSPFIFFGPYCILLGYLIFRSTFLPRVLGALMALAGLGWLIFLAPMLAHYLSSYIKVIGILAEGWLMLWLLVVGVNVPKWDEKTNRVKSSAT